MGSLPDGRRRSRLWGRASRPVTRVSIQKSCSPPAVTATCSHCAEYANTPLSGPVPQGEREILKRRAKSDRLHKGIHGPPSRDGRRERLERSRGPGRGRESKGRKVRNAKKGFRTPSPLAGEGRGEGDRGERAVALDVRHSFIVRAPAGSGKTELLVQRYLKLLETVEKPEEIVAITFTRKAAAEMRKRVIEKLSPELAPRLRIQTIDALCASLTRQMPVLAKFGAQPAVAEDASELYEEAAARTLADITPPVARLLAHLDNNVADAIDLVAGMLERRDQWLRKTGEAPSRGELEATLAAERDRLIRNAQALHAQASVELANEVLTQKDEGRKKPKPAPPELVAIPGLREALVALRAAPPARYTETQWEAPEPILALLDPAMAHLLGLFGERGEVEFTQIAHGALVAPGTPDEPTDLLLSIAVRVRHLLVDGFQDTSNPHAELPDRTTAGWETDDGRTVFVVGDPMQSIYRFRDAQVGLFLHARRAGLPGVKLEPLTLTTKFRSQAKIVEWVNEAFPHVLPAVEDESSGAVPYSPSWPFREATPDA